MVCRATLVYDGEEGLVEEGVGVDMMLEAVSKSAGYNVMREKYT